MVYSIILLLVFLSDQITKALYYGVYDKTVVDGFLSISYIENPGAAYGLGGDSKYGQPIFLALTIVFMLGILFFYFRSNRRHKLLHTALAFVVGGTLGNFVDRICFKFVRDFLEVRNFTGIKFFDFINFTCNVADIFLCVGAAMLMLYILFFDEEALFRKKPSKKEA